jgi:hypothetical protein
LESVAGKEPYKIPFILENGEITIAIDKDSIQNLKFQVHTVTMSMLNLMKIKVVQKKLMDFQNQNMQGYAAQQAKDTAVITNLMKGYSDIQAEVGAATRDKIYDIC